MHSGHTLERRNQIVIQCSQNECRQGSCAHAVTSSRQIGHVRGI